MFPEQGLWKERPRGILEGPGGRTPTVPGLMARMGLDANSSKAVEHLQRGIWPPSVLGKTPWLLWGEGSARGPREAGDGASQTGDGRLVQRGRGTRDAAGRRPAQVSRPAVCWLCVHGQVSQPLQAHLQSEDEGPLLSHSWTGPLCLPGLQPPPVSWRPSRPLHQPALPSPGRNPTLTRQPPAVGLESEM